MAIKHNLNNIILVEIIRIYILNLSKILNIEMPLPSIEKQKELV